MKKRSLRLNPVASLAPFANDGDLVAFNVGPDGVAYAVVAVKPLDYRTVRADGVSFAATVPAEAQTYRVVGLDGSRTVLDVLITDERFNIHDVQPLGDELLLVCARSHYRGPGDFERNGRVYTRDGRFSREILLGDGVKSVQATAGGVVWAGYFDEGVFGNYGWDQPVGAAGLVAWDGQGNKLYEYQPADGLDPVCDCYALNVESDEATWLYYYTDFPLVRVHRRGVAAAWRMPLGGSDAFAVSAGHALFRGGYRDRDTYQLFRLGPGGEPTSLAKLHLLDETGGRLVAEWVVGRGDSIHLVNGGRVYRVDVGTALVG